MKSVIQLLNIPFARIILITLLVAFQGSNAVSYCGDSTSDDFRGFTNPSNNNPDFNWLINKSSSGTTGCPSNKSNATKCYYTKQCYDKLSWITLHGGDQQIKMYRFNDMYQLCGIPNVPNITDNTIPMLANFTINDYVDTINIWYFEANSTMVAIQIEFQSDPVIQFVVDIFSNNLNRVANNSNLKNVSYKIAKEFVGLSACGDSPNGGLSNNLQFAVIDMNRCSIEKIKMPNTVSYTSDNLLMFISLNGTVLNNTITDNITKASSYSLTWSNCGAISYSYTVNTTNQTYPLKAIFPSAANDNKLQLQASQSTSLADVGIYKLTLKAWFTNYTGVYNTTTASVRYLSCNENSLTPSTTSINAIDTGVKVWSSTTLPTWTDSFSSLDYNPCSDISYSWSAVYTNGTAVDTSIFNFNQANRTFSVFATSNGQSTDWVSSNYIQITYKAYLTYYTSVQSSPITFNVALHFCNYTSFITTMSYDSGSTFYGTIQQDASQIFMTTSRTINYALTSYQQYPNCGYSIGNWTTTVTEEYGSTFPTTSYFNATTVSGTYLIQNYQQSCSSSLKIMISIDKFYQQINDSTSILSQGNFGTSQRTFQINQNDLCCTATFSTASTVSTQSITVYQTTGICDSSSTCDIPFNAFTYPLQVSDPNYCGTIQYSVTVSPSPTFVSLSATTINSAGNIQNVIRGLFNNLSQVGTYTVTIQASFVNYPTATVGTSIFTLNVLHPCETSSFISDSSGSFNLSPMTAGYSGISATQTFSTFNDSVSQIQGNGSSTCGRSFMISTAKGTAATDLTISDYSFSSSSWIFTINPTSSIGIVGTHTVSVTDTLLNYPSITSQVRTFTATINCYVRSISMSTPPNQSYTLYTLTGVQWSYLNTDVVLSPACTYDKIFTFSSNPILNINSVTPAINGDINFDLGPLSDQSTVGTYTGTITSTLTNYLTGQTIPTQSATFTFTVVDVCPTTSFTSVPSIPTQSITLYQNVGFCDSPLTCSCDSTSTCNISFDAFTYPLQASYSNLSFCGTIQYSVTISPSQTTVSLSTTTVSSGGDTKNVIQGQFNNANQVGTYTVTIQASLINYPAVVGTSQFTLIIKQDPCATSLFITTGTGSFNLSPMTAGYSGISATQTFSTFNDTVSQIQGNGSSTCGRSFMISTAKGTATTDLTTSDYSFSSSTWIFTINPTSSIGTVGTHTVSVTDTLLNYTSITSQVRTFTVTINCHVTSITMNTPPNQSYTLTTTTGLSWSYLNTDVILSPACTYNRIFTLSKTSSWNIYNVAPVTNGDINFILGPSTQRSAVGTYTGTITTSVTNYYNGTVLTASASFTYTIVDACLRTQIIKSTTYTDQSLYVWDPAQVYSTTTTPALPTYSDSVSTSPQSANYCGVITYTITINSNPYSQYSWFTVDSITAPTQFTFNSNLVSQAGSYTISIVAQLTSVSISTTNTFLVIIKDPCDLSLVTLTMQSASIAITAKSGTAATNIATITNLHEVSDSCQYRQWQIYDISTGLTLLNNSTEITQTNTSTVSTISVEALALNTGTHTIQVRVYFTTQNVPKDATFEVVVTPCGCTVSMTPITGYTQTYNLTLTPPASQTYTTTITQTNQACGYNHYLSVSVDKPTYGAFLSLSIPNSNTIGFTFGYSSDRAIAGTYTITLTASVDITNYPTAVIVNATQNLTIIVYDQCKVSVVSQNNTLLTKSAVIGDTNGINIQYFPFYDNVSISQNNPDYCGGITYDYVIYQSGKTTNLNSSSSLIQSHTQASSSVNGTFTMSSNNNSNALVYNMTLRSRLTSFPSQARHFMILKATLIDPCLTATIVNTTAIATMSNSVLGTIITQPIDSIFSDNVTTLYASTSQYSCGAKQYTLLSSSANSGQTTQLNSTDLSIDSTTGVISFRPTSLPQVGSYTATVQISLQNFSSRYKSFTFTVTATWCILQSFTYTMNEGSSVEVQVQNSTLSQITTNINRSISNAIQFPACGYEQQFSTTIDRPISIMSPTPPITYAKQADAWFSFTNSMARSLVGSYVITLTATVQNSTIPTTQVFSSQQILTIVLLDACRNSAVIANTISQIKIAVLNLDNPTQLYNSTWYGGPSVFGDSYSNLISQVDYCGPKTYSLSIISNTGNATVKLNTTSSPALNIISDSLLQQSTQITVQISAFLDAFPNNTATSSPFVISIQSACIYFTYINIQNITNLNSSVLAPAIQQQVPVFTDYISKTYGNGTDICGSRTYTITASDTNKLPSSVLSITPVTGIITFNPTLQSQVGNYTATVTVTLDNYSNISASTTFNVFVYPCIIQSLTISPISNYNYTLADPTNQLYIYSSNVTQNLLCNYTQVFSLDSLDQAYQFAFTTTLTPNQNGTLSIYNSNRTILYNSTSKKYNSLAVSIKIKVTLSDYQYANLSSYYYSPVYASAGSNYVSFTVTLLDPCSSTKVVIPTLQQDFYSFAGYIVLSQTPNKVNDTVTLKYSNISGSYCGSYGYSFNDTNNTNKSITTLSQLPGSNQIMFSPSQYTAAYVTQNVTFFSYLVDYPEIISKATFNITSLGYAPPTIPSYTYYVNSTELQFTIDDFTLLPKNSSFSNETDLTTAEISLYVNTDSRYRLSVPLVFNSSLVPLQNSNVSKWLNYSPTTRFLNFTIKDESYVGFYQMVVVKNFSLLQNPSSPSGYGQFAFTTFYIDVQTLPPPKAPNTPPYFSPALENQVVPCQSDLSYSWTYQLPNISIPIVNNTLAGIIVTTNQQYINFNKGANTLEQVKFVPNYFEVIVQIQLSDNKGNKAQNQMKITFECKSDVYLKKSTNLDFLNVTRNTSNQNSFPGAVISQIEKTSLMTIQFNTTMKIPNNTFDIKNGTVNIGKQVKPVLDISVIPGKQSNISKLDFNWTIVSFSSSKLLIQFNFLKPEYVSSQREKDNIQVIIYGNKYFSDQNGNFLRLQTQLVKELPKVTTKSLAEKLQTLGGGTSNAFTCLLMTNTFMTIFVAGPINQILGAIKQLQLSTHVLLVNVNTPAITSIFFSLLLQLLTLNFISTTDFLTQQLKLDDQGNNPYNSQFSELGYGALYILQNLGTLAFIMIGVPTFALLAFATIKIFKIVSLERYKIKLSNFLFFDGIISFVHETYLLIVITGFLNTFYLKWDSFGNIINSSICMVFITIACFYPLFLIVFYNLPNNYQQVQQGNEKFLSKFGSILEGLNFFREGKIVLQFPILTKFRQLVLGITTIYLVKYPVFSMFSLMAQSVTTVILVGYVSPYVDPIANIMEYFNEIFQIFTIYHLLCFTDFVPGVDEQIFMGYSLIGFTLVNIAVNLLVISWQNVSIYLRQFKIWTLKADQRARIRERIEKRQLEQRKLQYESIQKETERKKSERERQQELNKQETERKYKEQKIQVERQLEQRQQQIELTNQMMEMRRPKLPTDIQMGPVLGNYYSQTVPFSLRQKIREQMEIDHSFELHQNDGNQAHQQRQISEIQLSPSNNRLINQQKSSLKQITNAKTPNSVRFEEEEKTQHKQPEKFVQKYEPTVVQKSTFAQLTFAEPPAYQVAISPKKPLGYNPEFGGSMFDEEIFRSKKQYYDRHPELTGYTQEFIDAQKQMKSSDPYSFIDTQNIKFEMPSRPPKRKL